MIDFDDPIEELEQIIKKIEKDLDKNRKSFDHKNVRLKKLENEVRDLNREIKTNEIKLEKVNALRYLKSVEDPTDVLNEQILILREKLKDESLSVKDHKDFESSIKELEVKIKSICQHPLGISVEGRLDTGFDRDWIPSYRFCPSCKKTETGSNEITIKDLVIDLGVHTIFHRAQSNLTKMDPNEIKKAFWDHILRRKSLD